MTPDPLELESLLDAKPIHDETLLPDGTIEVKPEKASPFAMKMDKWGARRGEMTAHQWRRDGLLNLQEQNMADIERTNHVVADIHNCLFEPQPKAAENPADKARAAWLKQFRESPEYKNLHRQTMLDGRMAELACKPIRDAYVAYKEEENNDPENEDIGQTLDRIESTQNALQEAQDNVSMAKDIDAGLGQGVGGNINRKQMANYFQQLKRSERLRNIMSIAGRLRRKCQGLQQLKMNAECGEVTGIELAGDISRLLPSELAYVAGAVPELELLALLKLTRRNSMCYKHKKKEPVSCGPIVLDCDESGSMEGHPIEFAKALAMTMVWLANFQKRWCALVGFEAGDQGSVLVIEPGKLNQKELIRWLLHFYDGGTTLDVPCVTVPFELWPEFLERGMPRGKTDHIIISDDCVDIDDNKVFQYKAWAKTEHVKTYGILIGNEGYTGGVGKVCDKVWNIPALDFDSPAVTAILGI